MTLTPEQIRFEAALKSGAASGGHGYRLEALKKAEARRLEAEAVYQKFLLETGHVSSTDDFISQVEKQEKSYALGFAVADRLESLGRDGYRKGGSFVWLFAPLSGQYWIIPNFARNNFNPVTAQEKRNSILRELEFALQDAPNKHRMIVVTGGPHGKDRVTVDKLVAQWSWQNDKTRDWNKSAAAEYFGAKFIFRSNEAGSIFRKEGHKTRDEKGRFVRQYMRDRNGQRIRNVDANGNQTFHPHTHLILRMERFLPAKEWKQLITALQKHFDQVMPDHGAIADAREACKYVMKSDEVLHLTDADFLAFYDAVKGRHLVQPMGDLRTQKKHHAEKGLKLRRVRVGKEGEGSKLSPVVNWNRSPLDYEESEIKPFTQAANETTLCARMAPMPRFTPVYEPIVLMRGKVDLKAAYQCGAVRSIIARTKDAYEAGEQLFEALHGMKPLEWATTVAPMLAASRKVSAHTSPVTGAGGTEKAGAEDERGLSLFGGDPEGGEKQNLSKKPAAILSGRGTEKPRHRSELGLSLFGEL